MRWAFDLGEVASVRQHTDAILEQVAAGRMPCDAAWPAERVALFHRWYRPAAQTTALHQSPARPTTPGLTCGNGHPVVSFDADASVRHLRTAVPERIPARLFPGDFGLSMERSRSGHPVRGVG
jgi:hypothetical protein